MNKAIKQLLAVAAAFAFAGPAVVQAGFIGQTVQATACYSTLAGCGTQGGPVSAVVGAGQEFTDGQFTPFFGPSFDFDDNTISITHLASGHSSGDFNGYDFFDVFGTIDNIVGFSVISDTTGFFSGDPSRIFFNDDHLYVNFESLSFQTADELIVLGVQFASVPEPSILTLCALGLFGLGFSRRKKI